MIKSISIADSKTRLQAAFSAFSNKKILVIGDIGLDEYIKGSVERISPEAPVPVLEVKEDFYRLGLSTNVAQNIKAFGAEVLLVSLVGDDLAGDKLRALLKETDITDQYLVSDKSRPTTRKTRMMSDMHHIVRVDYESKKSIDKETEKKLLENIQTAMNIADAVIVQDYAKGLLGPAFNQQIIALAKEKSLKVYVDPHVNSSIQDYAGSYIATPNLKEAIHLSNLNIDADSLSDEDLQSLGQTWLTQMASEQMIITRSKDGMALFEKGECLLVPTFARQVYDVTGAGDTVIGAIALAQASGLSLQDSCVFANFAAGIVVAKVGAATASLDEILQSMNSY